MFGYIIRRAVSGILVLVATSVAVFALFFYGPSNPALAYCPETRCTPERLANITQALGLDRPVLEQYGDYMKGIVAGNDFAAGAIVIPCDAPCLGVSFKLRVDVADYLMTRFPATLSLAVGGVLIAVLLGVTLGIFASRVRGTVADKLIVGSSLIINAIPYYLLALLAFLYLISEWGLFPESQYVSPFTEGPGAWAAGLLLPWLVIGVTSSTQYARFSRGSMIESMNEDYVRTARAKGLTTRRTIGVHTLRNSLIPVVTYIGVDVGVLMGGALITETIFSIPGIGQLVFLSVEFQDALVIIGVVTLLVLVFLVANLIVDVLYAVLDPRIRYD
jgi:peptide/nickel transport system permease protein